MQRRTPESTPPTLLPYTTLCRSWHTANDCDRDRDRAGEGACSGLRKNAPEHCDEAHAVGRQQFGVHHLQHIFWLGADARHDKTIAMAFRRQSVATMRSKISRDQLREPVEAPIVFPLEPLEQNGSLLRAYFGGPLQRSNLYLLL